MLEKPFDPDEVSTLVRAALDHRTLVVENSDLRRRLGERVAETEILTAAPSMQRVLETVAAVADADAAVLLVGESGTGKELVANALHERSHRRQGPWIKINCAALPKDLIESELFGHTRGAFTGATTEKVGLLRRRRGAPSCSTRSRRCPSTFRRSSCASWRSAWCAGSAGPGPPLSTSG